MLLPAQELRAQVARAQDPRPRALVRIRNARFETQPEVDLEHGPQRRRQLLRGDVARDRGDVAPTCGFPQARERKHDLVVLHESRAVVVRRYVRHQQVGRRLRIDDSIIVGAESERAITTLHEAGGRYDRDAPLRADQSLIVGVIDTQTAFVEHPETVADRLERAAEMVGDPARIQAGTDCGFDTSAGMGRLTPDVVWAKLKAMQDGARLASERLF